MNNHWNLDILYKSLDDEKFKNDYEKLKTEIEKIKSFTSENFTNTNNAKEKLETYINLTNEISKLYNLADYCSLLLTVDSENSAALKVQNTLGELSTELTVPKAQLKKFLLTIENLDELINSSDILKEHKFFLEQNKEKAKHMLTESEELILEKFKLTGSTSWYNLHSLLDSTLEVEMNGQNLSLSTVRNMAYEKDAKTRKSAYMSELKAYTKLEKPMAASLNAIKGEAITTYKLRKYPSVLDMTLKNSFMDKESLDALLGAMREYMPKFEAYFNHKAKLLGLSGKLPFYDLYAPVGQVSITFTKEEACEFIIKNFSEFSEELGHFTKHVIENDWIDWDPKKGKMGGAFCYPLHSVQQSRILTNFSGSFYDMLTLAHELGHAYHGECLKNASYLNSDYSMPIAEVASTFCEILVCEAALKSANSAEKLIILENDLQGIARTIVDIYSRFLFEDEIIKRREEGSLSVDELKDIMTSAQKQAYGNGLDHEFLHPYMWACKVHYYSVDSNYYNFPYAYGALFAKGLYAKFLEEGASFAQKYKDLLAATGCNNLYDVGKIVDIDIRDINFWRKSLEQVALQIEEFVRS